MPQYATFLVPRHIRLEAKSPPTPVPSKNTDLIQHTKSELFYSVHQVSSSPDE